MTDETHATFSAAQLSPTNNVPTEDPVAIMTAYFEAHPEIPAEDIPNVLTVLVTDVTGTDERIALAKEALAAANHPLNEHLNIVEKVLR